MIVRMSINAKSSMMIRRGFELAIAPEFPTG